MDRRPIGLVGLGLLGSALAERFLRSGLSVVGYDVDPARCQAFGELGGGRERSAGAVVRACGRVVLSLPNTAIVETVLGEVAPHLRDGLTVMDTTTGDPDRTAAVGAGLAERGVHYLDATVVGSSEQVRAAEAVAMVGGERAAC